MQSGEPYHGGGSHGRHERHSSPERVFPRASALPRRQSPCASSRARQPFFLIVCMGHVSVVTPCRDTLQMMSSRARDCGCTQTHASIGISAHAHLFRSPSLRCNPCTPKTFAVTSQGRTRVRASTRRKETSPAYLRSCGCPPSLANGCT